LRQSIWKASIWSSDSFRFRIRRIERNVPQRLTFGFDSPTLGFTPFKQNPTPRMFEE
jgi:hypothetical protein